MLLLGSSLLDAGSFANVDRQVSIRFPKVDIARCISSVAVGHGSGFPGLGVCVDGRVRRVGLETEFCG